MDTDELRKRLERIFVDRWDLYSEDPRYVTDKTAAVRRFAERLAEATGKEVFLDEPHNINNYHRLQVCLTPGLPANRFTLGFDEIERAGEVVYLDILCSMLAPVSEASWYLYRIRNNKLVVESYDLLDTLWLSRHPQWDALALAVIRTGEETNLPVLSRSITRLPADPTWPRPQFAPDDPQLRHFLFSGYYDD